MLRFIHLFIYVLLLFIKLTAQSAQFIHLRL